jgi:hypothetical protein
VTASCFVLPTSLLLFTQERARCPSAASVLQPCGQGLLRVDYLQVIAGCVSSLCVESLEDLWSKLFSRSSFSNTPTKCSVKCPRGDKLFLSRVFIVYLAGGLISTSQCLRYSS